MLYAIIGVIVAVLFIVYGRWLKNKYLNITKRDFDEYEREKERLEYELDKIQNDILLQKSEAEDEMMETRKKFAEEIMEKQKVIQNYNDYARLREEDLQTEEQAYNARLRKFEDNYNEQAEKYKRHRVELIDSQVESHKQRRYADTQRQIEENTQRAAAKVKESVESYGEEVKGALCDEIDTLNTQIDSLRVELADTQRAVDDYHDKRRLINEAILRERALKEQEAFYKVCLTENAKEDIQQLRTIMPHLHDSTALYKIIYDLYVARAVKDMEKRVLNNEAFSGIYKITGPDGRVYIGKSTDIKARWQQHCKSAFHTGTISWALIHDEMEKVGIDQFTFEVIERAPKEKLTEREKFWIEFYEADKVGFNMRVG